LAKSKQELKSLSERAKKPNFWDNPETARKTSKKISQLQDEIDCFKSLQNEINDLGEIAEIGKEDKEIAEEAEKKLKELQEKVENLSLRKYLGGKWDKKDAIIEIYAGAGGREAEDWAAMLKRMYERYSEKQGFQARVLDISFGEPGGPDGRIGIKKAVLEIQGIWAFGYLKGEAGVHRLVRISPFSSQGLRHTSFAQIVVLPKLKDIQEAEIDLDKNDLKIETFRSSGPGGQYMQKTESAVRITHIPTNITVSCQSERLQGRNKEKALQLLISKLAQQRRVEAGKEAKKIKGEIDPAWGKQIRSYVLHPYKMVKDLRTNVEDSNPEAVLDGGLDEFVKEEIKIKSAYENN